MAEAQRAIAAAVEPDLQALDAAVVQVEKKPKKHTAMEIWEAQVAYVVGDRGRTVNAIEELSGAVISIPKQGWVRQVVIRGEAAARAEAEKMICATLPPTHTLEVAAAKIGSLLGYRGETIKAIEEWSGATVSVPREGDVRTVVICGPSRTTVDAAKAEVDEVLRTAPGPKRKTPKGNVGTKLWHR
jgi:polyribonucleotide nucleotidyltransferase